MHYKAQRLLFPYKVKETKTKQKGGRRSMSVFWSEIIGPSLGGETFRPHLCIRHWVAVWLCSPPGCQCLWRMS